MRYLPEGHSPHHNRRDIYLKGILLITTEEILTWRTFSSPQQKKYLHEGLSPHHNRRDIYLKDILLAPTEEIFTWRAFSSSQHRSYSPPVTPHRNLLSFQISVQTKLPHSPPVSYTFPFPFPNFILRSEIMKFQTVCVPNSICPWALYLSLMHLLVAFTFVLWGCCQVNPEPKLHFQTKYLKPPKYPQSTPVQWLNS
jgi:hypothetical protein